MITRRRFNTGLFAAAALPVLGSGHSARGADARLLRAHAGTAQLLETPAAATRIWGYLGQVPGPLLEANQGEAISIDFVNGLDQESTVHWHGVRIDNAMDGVANLTQAPVKPGETFAYRFTPPDAGTYWYHPHNRTDVQMARGLYGMLIVRERSAPAVDQDVPLVFDDWRIGDDGQIDARSFGAIHDRAHAGRLGNVLTLNGKPAETIAVEAGERVRFRLLNAANSRVIGVRFAAHAPIVIALDGQPVVPFAPDGNVVLLGPAQRADVMVDMGEDAGTQSQIEVLTSRETIHIGDLVYDKARRRRAKTLSDVIQLPANPMPRELEGAKAVRTDLVMSGGAMGGLASARYKGRDYELRELVRQHGKVWAFNGEAGMTREPIGQYRLGQTVEIRLKNETAWPHAMHFHGHHVKEVAHSSRAPEPHWRDTVLMMPREEITVAFLAHNPGKWMLHCHMLEHQVGGMATWYEVD